jgi:hypothetical protein
MEPLPPGLQGCKGRVQGIANERFLGSDILADFDLRLETDL